MKAREVRGVEECGKVQRAAECHWVDEDVSRNYRTKSKSKTNYSNYEIQSGVSELDSPSTAVRVVSNDIISSQTYCQVQCTWQSELKVLDALIGSINRLLLQSAIIYFQNVSTVPKRGISVVQQYLKTFSYTYS